jgi:hypothetical protein
MSLLVEDYLSLDGSILILQLNLDIVVIYYGFTLLEYSNLFQVIRHFVAVSSADWRYQTVSRCANFIIDTQVFGGLEWTTIH